MMDKQQKKFKRVVITGMDVIAPNGIGYQKFWKNTLAGVSGIDTLLWAQAYDFKSHVAGIIKSFDCSRLTTQFADIASLDRHVHFAIFATRRAIKCAKLFEKDMDLKTIGVCLSNAIAGTKFMEREFLRLTKNGNKPIFSAIADRGLAGAATFSTASMVIAKEYGIKGPVLSVPTGCAAGLDAIGASFDLIRLGKAKVMITGASESPLTPVTVAAFDSIGALSTQYNHCPQKASRPYEITRDGFVLGEGCGILILEEMEHALKRNAPILAELSGYGSTSNAYHMTGLPADGKDLARAIKIALDDALLAPTEIDYINAHGSATPQNDVNETNAIKQVFGQKAYQLAINSLKSLCGHALAAANAIETVAAIGCLLNQKVFPTINNDTPDPECDLNYTPNISREVSIKNIVKTASGFSGIHSAIVMSQFKK